MVWRNKFTHWIPVLFDENDSEKSLKDLESSIFSLEHSFLQPNQKFNPLNVLNIIPKLINNTITKLMNDNDYSLKNSEKLMITFTRFQYIFMFLAIKHPIIVEKTKEKVGLFRKSSCYRNKIVTPDLGEFLTYLYLCPSLKWKEIKEGLLITEFIGSSVNMITGDYSRGVSGFWIENGEITYPISEITIASNLKEMFLTMTAGNDLETSHSIIAPSLRIESMTVAGN